MFRVHFYLENGKVFTEYCNALDLLLMCFAGSLICRLAPFLLTSLVICWPVRNTSGHVAFHRIRRCTGEGTLTLLQFISLTLGSNEKKKNKTAKNKQKMYLSNCTNIVKWFTYNTFDWLCFLAWRVTCITHLLQLFGIPVYTKTLMHNAWLAPSAQDMHDMISRVQKINDISHSNISACKCGAQFHLFSLHNCFKFLECVNFRIYFLFLGKSTESGNT